MASIGGVALGKIPIALPGKVVGVESSTLKATLVLNNPLVQLRVRLNIRKQSFLKLLHRGTLIGIVPSPLFLRCKHGALLLLLSIDKQHLLYEARVLVYTSKCYLELDLIR